MATTTSILDDVKLREKDVSDVINYLTPLIRRTLRAWSNYRTEHLKAPDIFPCLAARPALHVHFEIDDPSSDTAYEKSEITLDYYADPKEEVFKPPVAELEALLAPLM